MKYERRKEDTYLLNRAWRLINPYIHVFGFIILCTFTATIKYTQIDAYAARLDSLEQKVTRLDRIEQKIDDLMFFLHVPTKKAPHL